MKKTEEEILTKLELGRDFQVLERYTEEDYTAEQLTAICMEKAADARKKGVSLIFHRQQDHSLELIIYKKMNK